MTSASHPCNRAPLARFNRRGLRCLAWLTTALLTACATQQPALPPTTPSPVAQPDAAPAPAIPAAPSSPVVLPVPLEKIVALRTWVEQQNRLYAIAAPLLLNNTPLCKRNARYLLGFTAKTKYSYSKDFIDAAQSALNLDDRLRVMNVLVGSGAAGSGVQRGDILLELENKPLPQGPKAEREAAQIIGSAMKGRSSLNLTVLRGEERLAITVPLTHACAFGIELGNTDHVNSYADGYRVMITRGMLDFAQSDEELAYALAKEIAHNVLAQSPRPRMGATIDSLRLPNAGMTNPAAPATTGIKPYTPVLDATADRLSLYMLARAGYGIDNALRFWKRLANQYPATVQDSHTALHPSSAYRFSVMTQVTQNIKAKQKHGRPLMP